MSRRVHDKVAIRNAVLPTLDLTVFAAGVFGLSFRASIASAVQADCRRAARARGMSDIRVIWTHGLRNSLLPFITVFNHRGLGRLLIQGITSPGYFLIQRLLLVLLLMFAVLNFTADAATYFADPRTRRESRVQ